MRMDEIGLPARARIDASGEELEECFAQYHSYVERLKVYRSDLESRIERLSTSAVEDIERLKSEEKYVDRMINAGQAHLASMMAMRALSLHVQ